MFGFLRKFRPVRTQRNTARYEQEKQLSLGGDLAARRSLAANPRTHQEILFYMAENDPDPSVRQAVAANLATPLQASTIIARDHNADVRIALAERLVRLLPQLTAEDHSQLYAVTVQALGTLAGDTVLNVRIALSSALRDCAFAPPAVAAQLARDAERAVAEPVLRFCAALPDDALLDILAHTDKPWVRAAIAGRAAVGGPVAAALIATRDRPAGRALIWNQGAAIGPALLRDIVEQAQFFPEWQEPVALRKGLPPELAKTLAAFAGESVFRLLVKRRDFDRATRRDINESFKRRLNHVTDHVTDHVTGPVAQNGGLGPDAPRPRALALAKAGKLTETIILDAMAMHDDSFVVAALSCLTGIGAADVERVIKLHAAKPLTALCWKAGLSMRAALELQKGIGRVRPTDLLYPRDGTDYPLSESDLVWQLEFLGLDAG